jgi:hypothetical protein
LPAAFTQAAGYFFSRFPMIEDFKDQFRVFYDAQREPYLKCAKEGIVYDYNAETFGVWVQTGRPSRVIMEIQAKFPAVRAAQVGEGECTYLFKPASPAEAVNFLKAIGAHKVKSYSPETLEKLKAGGRLAAEKYRPWERKQC